MSAAGSCSQIRIAMWSAENRMVVTTASKFPGPRAIRTHRLVRVVMSALLTSGSAGCATGAAAPGPTAVLPALGEHVDSLLGEPPFDRVHWGLLLIDARSGRVLSQENPDLLFIPGSNMKLPVTAAALGILGPDYRWQTTFFSRVLPVDGVLDGHLYLPAAGDPTLGEPFHESSKGALEALADSLLAAGVNEVTGRLVIDVSAWDSTSVPESWMVEDLPVSAGATGGAFVVHLGQLEIQVRGADRAGVAASVDWTPRGRDLEIGGGSPPFVEHRVDTLAEGGISDLRASFLPESRRWLLEGAVTVNEVRTLSLSARDPVRLGVAALARALADRGVEIANGAEIIWNRDLPLETACSSGRVASCAEMLRIAGMPSPPLIEVVSAILGPSQNWMTEQLVRTLGAETGTEGSWSEGFSVIGARLEAEAQMGSGDVHWEDGSGLSNHNLISPRALVSILQYARRQPWGPAFRSSLAQPGLEETTLSSRLEGLEGRVFAKTGSLSHVNSLSGYLIAADGRELLFSILTNGSNLSASQVRGQIDAVVREMAR